MTPNPQNLVSRDDANLATTTAVLTEVNYMVETHGGVEIEEISSIPEGHAIIDTGCTTSVVGEETAAAYTEFFKQSGFPAPQPVELLLIHMMMMMLKLKPHQTKVMSMHVFVVVNMNMKKPINTMPLILKPCMEKITIGLMRLVMTLFPKKAKTTFSIASVHSVG